MRRTLLKAYGFGSPTRDHKPAAQARAWQRLERPWVGSSKRFSIGETWRAEGRKPPGESSKRSRPRTGSMRSSYQGRVGDALAPGGEEGRGRLRYARGSCQTSFDPGMPESSSSESIA